MKVTQFRGEEYTAHLDLGQRQARGAMPASKVVVIITRSLVLVILASVGEVVLEERLDRIQVLVGRRLLLGGIRRHEFFILCSCLLPAILRGQS